MRILAINCASSSIKSALIDSASGARLLDLRVTGIGAPAAVLRVEGVDRLPIFRTSTDAGHGGKSGRFESYREIAEEYAFILDQSGIAQ